MENPFNVLNFGMTDTEIQVLLARLREGGFTPTCTSTRDLTELDALLKATSWNFAVIDAVASYSSNGLEAVSYLQTQTPELPSIVITDPDREELGVLAMYAGAHDYLMRGDYTRLLPIIGRELSAANMRLQCFQQKHALELKETQYYTLLIQAVNALSAIAERTDHSAMGHQLRVSELACAIAKHLGLSDEQTAGIRVAGRLHDIGKSSVPDDILWKPGKLTQLEMALVKTHPQAGYSILRTIPFPWPVAQVALQHHERLNGSGYPNGLAGDDILLEARIIAVADVVDAISSHRAYRPAFGYEEIVKEITQQRNVLYDATVVDACLAVSHAYGNLFPQQSMPMDIDRLPEIMQFDDNLDLVALF
ncbi:MAG: HD-GYP domain-containing protein [Armatimonadota bacterium]